MYKTAYKITIKEALKSFGVTIIFNTLIALTLYFLVLDHANLVSIFVVSQFIGISICSFVLFGMHVGVEKGKKGLLAGIMIGLFAGIGAGSYFSWLYLSAKQGISISYFFRDVLSYMVAFGVICGIPIIYFFSSSSKIQASERAVQAEKIKRLTLEKESGQISLKLLQAQIEPHFLFNTLSNVLSLLDSDIEKGKSMLFDLNEYLRISLSRTRTPMITLSQELDLVKHYLNIYKVRMGKRLEYTINDRTQSEDIYFPPLILQPLVENAIKHGLEPTINGGKITIDCLASKEDLKIKVSDTGRGLNKEATQGGIGIDNINRRLKTIYGDAADLTLSPNIPDGLNATIKVPL